MTSTLPLDCGGYDDGILNRPLTLAEAMRDCGHRTIGLTPSPWLGFLSGYGRGFDEFHELFDLRTFWVIFSGVYHRFYNDLRKKGVITDQEYRQIVGGLLEKHLTDLLRQCQVMQQDLAEKRFPFHTTLHGFDFAAMQRGLSESLAECRRDRDAYVSSVLTDDLTQEVVSFVLGKSRRSPLRSFIVRASDHLLKSFWTQIWRYEYSVPASYLTKQVISSALADQSRPFFLWTHFLDIHDKTFIGGRIGLPPNGISLGLRRLMSGENPATMTQAFSLRFIDRQVAKILKALKANGSLESTLIVISGDHGTPRHSLEKMPGNLFDESVHVPVIFYNPGLEPRVVAEPCGLIDIAPTILDLLGKEPRPEFQGRSVLQPAAPESTVILETLGPGPCDLRYKAIKMAVIRGRHKLIWREPGYENSCPPGQNYLFDLQKDPEERDNLYSDSRYATIRSDLESIVLARCARIRSEASERSEI